MFRRGLTTSTISPEPEIQWNFGHPELQEAAEHLFRAQRCLIHGGLFERNRASQRAAFPQVLSSFPPGSREEAVETEAVEHFKRSGEAMQRLHLVCPECGKRWSKELFRTVMSAVVYCELPNDGETVH